ncbi:MAG TPA: ATP-dependent DNA helicase, partial [Saprospiraceae bacterium]|nr:ATP-dependent DNA helicase [Saprospiraceae bacterium]
PVMVIAGPGTGKTEILSQRIGYILKNTDTPPGSILCLTYTDAAATEMRTRLIELIGPEAYRIQVSTFHSFCNIVIQENPGVFQQARELEPISEIDKFRLIQELIDSFPEDHLLKRFKGQTYADWKRLDELFTTMKKEKWPPDFMYEHIDEYVARMREDQRYRYQRKYKEFNAGDLKEKEFNDKVLSRMEVLKAAIGEYDRFNALLAAHGQYDFDDMLLWVYNAFDQSPDLLANYQERFLYFLVDEFQDTNGIQIAILQKLIDHEWLDRPNIFVVGDDDQAIFRFQGANIENLISFHERYQPEVIFLEENYRSSQLILDTSRVVMNEVDNSLIRQIFSQEKKLTASGPAKDHPRDVMIQAYPTLSYENAVIFQQLQHWHKENLKGEIAILYPKHELGRELAQALKGAGIPFHSPKKLDALRQPLIQHLLTIVQCIHQLSDGADNDDALLYQTLHLRYLQPHTRDLQRLMLAFTSDRDADFFTFYAFLADKDKQDQLNLEDRPWIDRICKLLNNAVIEYHSRTLVSFVEWVVHEFGIMQWILHQAEKYTPLYLLKTFYTFLENQSAGKAKFGVPELLELCDLMTTYNIQLPVQELLPGRKGIHLSSLHGAKGLEFDKVIIKNLTDTEWEKKRASTNTFSYPDNLVRHGSFSNADSDELIKDQDRRRLLYVGMTRAKTELVLSYATAKDDSKGLVPSLYLAELEKYHPEISKSKPLPDEGLLAEYLKAYMSGGQTVDLEKDEDEIKNRVKNFVLNATALNTYLECPLRFYYEKILEIPATQKSYLIFGSALHDALHKLFDRRFKQKD